MGESFTVINGAISDCCDGSVTSYFTHELYRGLPDMKDICSKCKKVCSWKTVEQREREAKTKNMLIAGEIREERRKALRRFRVIEAVAKGWNYEDKNMSIEEEREWHAKHIIAQADAILKQSEQR
jgi:hypothetical protein